MNFTADVLKRLSHEALLDVLSGNTQYPVTAELLNLIEATYENSPILQAAFHQACDAPFADEDRLLWLADYASRTGDREMWLSATTNGAASLELMTIAPAALFTLHTIQAFIWKHSLANNYLWSDQEVGEIREICASESEKEPEHWITMGDAMRRMNMENG